MRIDIFFCQVFVTLVQTTVIWEERAPDEEKSPLDWPMGVGGRSFLD